MSTTPPKLPPEVSTDVNDVLREGAANKEKRQMETTSEKSGEGLDTKLQAQIGQKLKSMYDEVANAPIPDKFLELLSKLDGRESDK